MSERKKNIILAVVFFAVIIFFDQFTKLLIVDHMELGESKPVIENIFEIRYIQNTGMAWGLMSGKTWLLAIFSGIMLLALIYVYHNVAEGRYYRPVRILLICIVGGAYGNLLDRIRLGYVVDFLYFKMIDFPVFNVADIFVTLSVIILIFLMIFKYKGNDLDVLLGDKIRLADGTYIEKKEKKVKEILEEVEEIEAKEDLAEEAEEAEATEDTEASAESEESKEQ
jgi:signal peptidase II